MSPYRIIALSADVADEVRASLQSPQYGHPAHVESATGFGPCRYCLRTFREGKEDRVLFTYNAFAGTDLTPLPGPVFIHHKSCARYVSDGFPEALKKIDLLLEGYDSTGRVIELENPGIGKAEDSILNILCNDDVAFVHIRNAKAGCYVARVERSRAAA